MSSGDDVDTGFAQAVRRLREGREQSQEDLARTMREVYGYTNFHPTTISRIEKGDRPVRIGEARTLAAALNASLHEMLTPDVVSASIATLQSNIRIMRRARNLVAREVEDWELRQERVEVCINELDTLLSQLGEEEAPRPGSPERADIEHHIDWARRLVSVHRQLCEAIDLLLEEHSDPKA